MVGDKADMLLAKYNKCKAYLFRQEVKESQDADFIAKTYRGSQMDNKTK
jgi:hypothetical protein